MTLEQVVGQLLWCGWGDVPEPDPRGYNEHARFLIEDLGVGGIVLFTRNLGTPEEVAALAETLRARAAVPPLIGIDQEGGRVSRMPLPGMVFPGNMALGLLDDPDQTRSVTRAIGEQLAAVGVDVDFAPSVDVNNNPRNPIIGVRSFGEDPERVARHGVAAVTGFRDAGILPVVKHFPGHGDTSRDSHLELPVQPADRARLEAVELPPFRAAIAAGAPAVMTTHIMFPALDPDFPATLSRRILTDLLRNELGFNGLIVTDCLEMNGIAAHWSPEETAVLAVEAGADMLLVCHTRETQARMYAALLEAVRTGRLTEERVRASAARVARARELVAGVREAAPEPSRISAPVYRELERETADACLAAWGTVPEGVVPFRQNEPVLVAGASGPARNFAASLRECGFDARVGAATEPLPGAATQVVWLALPDEPFAAGIPTPEVAGMLAAHPRAVVAAVREPYCLEHYPDNVPRIAAWGALPVHLQALARWLSGARVAPLLPWGRGG